MKLPVQLTFRGVPRSAAVQDYVLRRADKLDGFSKDIVRCRVAVESPHRHSHHGKLYHIRIDLTAVGHELVVHRDRDEDLYACIDGAFDDAQRVVQDYARRRRQEVKRHEPHARGRVTRIFSRSGYGFIETPVGEEIYFHENSVQEGRFEDLEIGTLVRYAEELGDKGPQASRVLPVKRGATAKTQVSQRTTSHRKRAA